jgi:hypothetical protein
LGEEANGRDKIGRRVAAIRREENVAERRGEERRGEVSSKRSW